MWFQEKTTVASISPNRLDYVDVMRVAACFAVVLLHASLGVVNNESDFGSMGWWFGNIIHAATTWAVPAFVMISGSLLIDANKKDSLKSFFTRRMSRLLIPTIFWSFLYMIYDSLAHGTPILNPFPVIWSIAYGMPYHHLWYLYVAIGLYGALIPIRVLCINADRQTLLITLLILFSVQTIYFLDQSRFVMNGIKPDLMLFIYKCIPFIPYFICGYFLTHSSLTPSHLRLLIYLQLALVLLISTVNWSIANRSGVVLSGRVAFNVFNPLVVLYSILMYRVVKLLCSGAHRYIPYVKKTCSILAPFTLGIFLIHPLFFEIIKNMPDLVVLYRRCYVGIIPIAVCVFIVSAYTTYVISRIPYLKKVIL
jgi:surface polysaccharide O-acyltransferase-like enzyme